MIRLSKSACIIPSSTSLSEIYSLISGGSVGYITKNVLTGFIESSLQLSLFTGQSTDYFRIRVQQQRRRKRGKNVSQTQQIFGCIVTDQKYFLAARNDGGDRAGPGHLTLDKTLDTGHSGTTAGDTDDSGTLLHSQNILHFTYVGLILICK